MGNLRAAVNQAMAICWDEGYGYNLGGTATSHANGVDCSGLINRVLHDNGFDYPASHVGTKYMESYLRTAGFNIINVTSLSWLNNNIKPGDIVVMNHYPIGEGGHTFIYMENIRAYTDYSADSDHIGTVSRAKVEAASSRGETSQGDHKKNGTGAYWEVWCHAYYELCPGYDPTDPNDEIYIARWPGGLEDIFILKRIRDGQFNFDSWTNKYTDFGI